VTGGRVVRSAVLLGAAWLLGASAARGQDAGAILDGAVAAFSRVTTLRADFVQYLRDPMLGGSDTSWGEFLQQRPGKFAMRWRHPSGDLLLADGEALWVFLPSSAPNQVVRSKLTSRPGESADVVAEFLDQPRQRFLVSYVRSDSVGQRAADVLSLVPRQGNVPYRRVLIWVAREDSLVRRVEINEGSGAVRRITFDRLRTNQPIPASMFIFRLPAGIRVVDASH
jgi:outer membrane lipoprotein-sorting protein